jgi:hypothetical protein
VLVSLPAPTGALHHVELRVPDLTRAEASLGWLLTELGWLRDGLSWRRGSAQLVVTASVAGGPNHIALHAGSPDRVGALTDAALARGWQRRGACLVDPDGFEVELVATPTSPGSPH